MSELEEVSFWPGKLAIYSINDKCILYSLSNISIACFSQTIISFLFSFIWKFVCFAAAKMGFEGKEIPFNLTHPASNGLKQAVSVRMVCLMMINIIRWWWFIKLNHQWWGDPSVQHRARFSQEFFSHHYYPLLLIKSVCLSSYSSSLTLPYFTLQMSSNQCDQCINKLYYIRKPVSNHRETAALLLLAARNYKV